MQFYKGKEYIERDIHVLNENNQQDILRIMDEDFLLLNEGSLSAPDDWKEIKDTVAMFLPLDKLMLTPDDEIIKIINEKNNSNFSPRKEVRKKWFNTKHN